MIYFLRYIFSALILLFSLMGIAQEPPARKGALPSELDEETLALIAEACFQNQVSPQGHFSKVPAAPYSTEAAKSKLAASPSFSSGTNLAPLFETSPNETLTAEALANYMRLTEEERNAQIPALPDAQQKQKTYMLNYQDIPVIELLKIVSEITNTNFVFDGQDLNFTVTIVSEEPTTVDDLFTSLLQILQMHGLSVVEQGDNIVIYNNDTLARISTIVTEENRYSTRERAIITRVFRLHNISPEGVVHIVKPLLSKDAIVEVSMETRHLIVSDMTANVEKVGDLLTALDTPDLVLDVSEYHVKSAYPNALVAYAREILAPLVQSHPLQMIAQTSSNTIFIVSSPFLIRKTIQVLQSLDSPMVTPEVIMDLPSSAMVNNNFFLYKLRYHDGEEVANALRDIGINLQRAGLANMDLVNTINSMQWIRANNSLVFSGTDQAINKVKQLLLEIDVAPKQVFIEVLIIDTTIANSLNFGVQWAALANEQQKLAFGAGFLNAAGNNFIQGADNGLTNPPPNAARDIPLPTGFGIGVVGDIITHNGKSFLTLASLVSALEQESDTVIVLNPRILSEDTKEANLFVGQNIPYQTTSTIIRDTGSVTQNIQYEDVGVQLRVTPIITPGNIVTLQIDQSVSDVASTFSTVSTVGGNTNIIAPTTNKTLTSTRIHVPNGAFVIMAGDIDDRRIYTRSGIPCLGTLPYIGPLFSSTSESRRKRSLILFLRPVVLSGGEEAVEFTNCESYKYNWNADPRSIRVADPIIAPEGQVYSDCR